MKPFAIPALVIASALPLSACISFGAKPPPALLTLEPTAIIPVGETRRSGTAATITVAPLLAPQELAVPRVPVRSSDTVVAYLKDAQWVEPPTRLFRRLLADTIGAKTGRMVLSVRQAQVDPGARLSGELRAFGVDATTSEVVVTYDASLVRGPDSSVIEDRRFEARVPVAKIESGSVAIALNQAANQVANEVAAWVGR
jgi:cholesterol transport system auxiliary component